MRQCIWHNLGYYTISLESVLFGVITRRVNNTLLCLVIPFALVVQSNFISINKLSSFENAYECTWMYYKFVGCRRDHWGVVVWIMAKGKKFFISSKVLFVLPRLLFSGYWQLCPWEQSGLGVRLINYLHLVPRLKRRGVVPLLLHMPLRYSWEIFTFSYECLEALLRLVSFGWWLHVSSMPASYLVISALRFWSGDWQSRLLSDFGQEIDCLEWFQILARRWAVWSGFRY